MNACAAINREKAAPKARLSRDVVAAVFLVGGVVAALRYGAGDFVAVLLCLWLLRTSCRPSSRRSANTTTPRRFCF